VSDLLKKLAEIEGIEKSWMENRREFVWACAPKWDVAAGDWVVKEWNPKKNDAQALALVKKYGLCLRNVDDEWLVTTALAGAAHEDLNTAICMAIVESKEVG